MEIIKTFLKRLALCVSGIASAGAAWLFYFRYMMAATQCDLLEIYVTYMMFVFMPALFLPGLIAELMEGLRDAYRKYKKRPARPAGRRGKSQH